MSVFNPDKAKKRFHAQSAMEYMMTYGWALLVIAVVLVALVALGIFSPSSGNTCIPVTGFQCSNPLLDTSGNLIVQVSQLGQGQSWSTASLAFVPQSQLSSPQSATYTPLPTMVNGVPVTVGVPVSSQAISIGTSYSGQLWVEYTTPSTSGPQYTELASISVKASCVGSCQTTVASSSTSTLALSSSSSTSSSTSIASSSSTSSSSTSTSTSTSSSSSTTTTSVPPIEYTYMGTASSGETTSLLETIPAQYSIALCGGVMNDLTNQQSTSWTVDEQFPSGTDAYGSIGHETTSPLSCSLSYPTDTLMVVGAIGVNNPSYSIAASGETTGASFSAPFSVSTAGTYSFIIVTGGYTVSMSLPSGCNELGDYFNSNNNLNVWLGVCPDQAIGSYTISGSGLGYYTWVVYQFA